MTHKTKWIEASPDEPVTDVAARSLKQRLRPVQHYMPLAANHADEDVEHVHHLRIWSRRANAAIAMFDEFLPAARVAWMTKQLKRIRRATSDARDDDVFAARLALDKDDRAAARLLQRVHDHRRKVQRHVIRLNEFLESKDRLASRIRKLVKRVRLRGPGRADEEPLFGHWAPDHLRPTLQAFYDLADGDLSNISILHKLRIAGKQVRYATEVLSGAFPRDLRDNAQSQLSALHERLGQVTDHAAARARICGWIAEDQGRKVGDYLSGILAVENDRLSKCQGEFLAWWTANRREELRDAFEHVLTVASSDRAASM